ncbi:hypothetical protein K3172_07300 [Qipengyuania sp. 6B39]|uniref:hypothetical protein n=1 Tax=Qipengyuania proteolytica TaxID=2867239 RepID=UPI001C8A1815|nr:hypothetical protein [Qipengyuania proteolytica]MBX7495663.1 hypothetical protein [Qipengyuania proteolytica]
MIEDAYRAFRDVERPVSLERSPYRRGDENDTVLRVILDLPLRDITDHLIGPYSGWAMTTVGTGRDYQYFLPRILQLALEDPTWIGVEPPLLAWRIRESGWSDFSTEKREAVLAVFTHAMARGVSAPPDEDDSYLSWWSGAVALDWPVENGCELIRSMRGENVALQLATSIVDAYSDLLKKGRLKAQFAEEYEDEVALEAMTRFLLSEETEARIIEVSNRASADDVSMILEPALAYIELFRSS